VIILLSWFPYGDRSQVFKLLGPDFAILRFHLLFGDNSLTSMYSDIIFYFCSKPDSPDSFFFAFRARRAGKKKEIPFLTPIISSYFSPFSFLKHNTSTGKITILICPLIFPYFYRHSPCVLGIINSVSCQLMLPWVPSLTRTHNLSLSRSPMFPNPLAILHLSPRSSFRSNRFDGTLSFAFPWTLWPSADVGGKIG
jgi:hypothetical protein